MASGLLVEVQEIQLGSHATAMVPVGGTVIPVEDVTDFNQSGIIDVAGDVQFPYVSVDPDASTLTLADPLTVQVDDLDPIRPIVGERPATDRVAVVDLGGAGDTDSEASGDLVYIPLDYYQRSVWPVQQYSPPLPVQVSDDLDSVANVFGVPPILTGEYQSDESDHRVEIGNDSKYWGTSAQGSGKGYVAFFNPGFPDFFQNAKITSDVDNELFMYCGFPSAKWTAPLLRTPRLKLTPPEDDGDYETTGWGRAELSGGSELFLGAEDDVTIAWPNTISLRAHDSVTIDAPTVNITGFNGGDDTGWTSLPSLISGITVEYRVKNGWCSIRTYNSGTTDSSYITNLVAAGHMPAEYCPSVQQWGPASIGGAQGMGRILDSGRIDLWDANGNSHTGNVFLSITYPIE